MKNSGIYRSKYDFFEKFHISVKIKLTYIGQYMHFNIDRYMISYSVQFQNTIYQIQYVSERSYDLLKLLYQDQINSLYWNYLVEYLISTEVLLNINHLRFQHHSKRMTLILIFWANLNLVKSSPSIYVDPNCPWV